MAKRSIDYMKELGIADEMIVGPEYEFYVFDRVGTRPGRRLPGSGWTPVKPSGARGGTTGIKSPKAGYHTTLPQDVTRISGAGSACCWRTGGIRVKYHHPEVGGCGQMEIEVELGK